MVDSRAGFLGGEEVVEVQFDAESLTFDDLLAHAERHECARKVFTTSDAQLDAAREVVGERAQPTSGELHADKEPKYYLFKSALRAIPMTGLQAIRVNARLQGGGAEELLSPRQRALLARIREHPEAAWPNLVGRTDLARAWDEVDAVRARGKQLRRARSPRESR